MKLLEPITQAPVAPVSQRPAAANYPSLMPGSSYMTRIRRGEQGWQLESDTNTPVRVAVSCLVEPLDGDQVLVASINGVCYVLAVLERDWQQGQRIDVDLGGGELHLKAANIVVEVERNLDLQAENFRLNAELSVQNASTQVVNVAGISVLNANSIALDGKQSLTMHTSLGAIQASALLKIDGTQMHFG
jgi:hypothetical protein